MTRAEAQASLLAKGIAPRGLTLAEAAAYVGVCDKTFKKLVAGGKMPAAHSITGRWDRVALDRVYGPTTSEEALRAEIEEAIDAS